MTKHKRNGKPIHLHVMGRSRPAEIELCFLLQQNFLSLCAMYERTRGDPLVPPQSLDGDMIRWRKMRWRHTQGDYRHSEAEMKSVRTLCQWTVDVKNALTGKESDQIEWREE